MYSCMSNAVKKRLLRDELNLISGLGSNEERRKFAEKSMIFKETFVKREQ
jgi:hypothetical protein